MPLTKSSSREAVSENIRAERAAGKPERQAVAIALDVARRAKRAIGGQVPWQVKAEARNMMHTGPILSAVPGRTDRHNVNVPSGSYILPADLISHLGQSNSVAGLKVANRMFNSVPFGTGAPKMPHGAWAPHNIAMPRGMSDAGGARGEGTGEPTPVVVAGGEFAIRPEVVAHIGGGDLKRGHKTLDKWVMEVRKKHISTLRKLPEPVKS